MHLTPYGFKSMSISHDRTPNRGQQKGPGFFCGSNAYPAACEIMRHIRLSHRSLPTPSCSPHCPSPPWPLWPLAESRALPPSQAGRIGIRCGVVSTQGYGCLNTIVGHECPLRHERSVRHGQALKHHHGPAYSPAFITCRLLVAMTRLTISCTGVTICNGISSIAGWLA